MDEVRLGSRTLQPRRQLMADGERLAIGRRALDILSVLAEAKGEIVTKDELLDAVWPGVTVEENALQVHIVALRKALGPEADRLKTIRGVGYQLEIDAGSPVIATPVAPEMTALSVANESPRPDAPLPAPAGPSGAAAWIGAAWARARTHKFALALVGLLVVVAGAWTIFGSQLGLRPQERIPVVVRELAASGSGPESEAALAGGITDELIFRLRRIPDLRVATAESDGTVPGGAFRGAYVVDGSIRSSGDRLQVTVRLTGADGEILWQQTLNREMADLFDMQEEIAAAIAGALSVSFEVGANAPQYGGTDNPEAYAAYMQYYAHQWDPDQSVARRYLERAVAIDPRFVKGLFGLGQNYAVRSGYASSEGEAEAMLAMMDDTTAQALAADADLALGPMSRGWYRLMRGDIVEADKLMERATELDSGNDPELRTNLAIYWIYTGRVKKGASVRQSNELIDPIYRNDPWKIFDYMMLGRYRESVDLYDKLRRNDQLSLSAFAFHASFSYLLMGEEEAAFDVEGTENFSLKDELRAMQSDTALATMSDAELARWARRYPNQVRLALEALLAAHSGHDRLATRILRLAFDKPGTQPMLLLWHPAMANARRTPEFERLVTDIGLVKAWRESGDWGDYCRPVSAQEITCS